MRMNGLIALSGLAVLIGGTAAAEARPNDRAEYSSRYAGSVATSRKKHRPNSAYRSDRRHRAYASAGRHRAGGRPAKWCGWWMRTQKGGGPQYNVAWNWRNYGRPASAQIGAVVVWRHHVGMITGKAANGRWIVTSGNDGGRVRSRPRTVSGAVFRI